VQRPRDHRAWQLDRADARRVVLVVVEPQRDRRARLCVPEEEPARWGF
jgi:hypothetical protein